MQQLQPITPVESLQDEGACWAPNAIWPSIMLMHWGRKVYTASGISLAHCACPRCQEFELHLNATIWQNAYQGAKLCNALTQFRQPTLQDLLHTSNTAYGGAPPRRLC